MSGQLVAPFPWFGGKRTVAADVWARFGDAVNYVEPFFGSGAVLLNRPEPFSGPETINDADGFVANFWRAAQSDPEAVAIAADWPVNEHDLQARHYWLVTKGRQRLAAALADPAGFDALIAGWWVWGLCSWIGSGWCSGDGPWQADADGWRKLPHLGDAGRGINRQHPHLGDAGRGERLAFISDWLGALSERLRGVRVTCGDWSRVCGPSVTTKHGITAVFLDPPYSDEAGRADGLYATDCGEVAHLARKWAIDNGSDKNMRIALCGYAGEHQMPQGWTAWAWKARGGYGSQSDGDGRANAERETIWFSPHCIDVDDTPPLFALMESAS